MKNILIVMGTRPEIIKLAPIYHIIKKSSQFNCKVVFTGQQDSVMTSKILSIFSIKTHFSIQLDIDDYSLSTIFAYILQKIDKILQKEKVDLLFVQGDTTSSVAATLAAYYNRVPIAHLEAGLRTFDKLSPYPEEINRVINSHVADIHFAPTEFAKNNLKKENIIDQVKVVGNSVIDSLLLMVDQVNASELRYKSKFSTVLAYDKVILVTLHRRENIGANFKNICNALLRIAIKDSSVAIVIPVHRNPLISDPIYELLSGQKNILLLPPLPYDELVFLMKECYLVMTDSGGLQEEAPALNKPVIILRDTTERQEGIDAGCTILGGTSTEQIITTYNKLSQESDFYKKMSKRSNPYGDGTSSKQIMNYLLDYFNL